MSNINKSLLLKLKESNININIEKFASKLPQTQEKAFKIRNITNESDFQSTATSGFRNNPSTARQSSVIEENKDDEEFDYESEPEEYFTMNEEFKELIQDQINDELLEKLTCVSRDEFYSVIQLTIKFNADCDSLYYAGQMLPNLLYLKLNKSIVKSIRSIGTQMQNLKVIWIKNSQLEDLSGFNAFPQLEEFYASYNNIKMLEPIMFHENLSVLDLQGNEIEDPDAFMYLETLLNLKELTLAENEIEKLDDFKERVKQSMPELQFYNDQPIQKLYEEEKQQPMISESVFRSAMIQQIDLELMKEPQEQELITQNIKLRANTQHCDNGKIQTNIDDQEISDLTNTGQIYSGNPLKALKDKRIMEEHKEIPSDIQSLIKQFQTEYDDVEMKILEQELNRIQDKPLIKMQIRKPTTANKLQNFTLKGTSTKPPSSKQTPILSKQNSNEEPAIKRQTLVLKKDSTQFELSSSNNTENQIDSKTKIPLNTNTLSKIANNKLKFQIKPRIKNVSTLSHPTKQEP